MRNRLIIFTLFLFSVPALAIAQQKDTLIKKLDSLSKQPDSVGAKQKNNIRPETYNENTKITPRVYMVLVWDDMKQQITSPFRATSQDWLKIGGFGLVTTAVVLFADKPVNRMVVDIRKNSNTVTSTSTYVTRFGASYEVYTLAALGAFGLIFKKEKTKTTTLLATQAYLTAIVLETSLKYITGRQRPSFYDPLTTTNSPTWHGPFYQFTKDKNGNKPNNLTYLSFPSGHTTLAFAAATVFAMEYRNTRIIPIIAYSAATLVGLSRLTENAHWASDVLVGAALGFLCGRQVVNNYHRYSKIQSQTAKKKNTLSFSLNYQYGTLLPGVVYRFR
jgi:membrane-associated phospholipid phosphatase